MTREQARKAAEELVSRMTVEEMAGQLRFDAEAVERLGVPASMVSDGPHGLRKQDEKADHLGVNESIKATNLHGYLGVDGTWYTPEQDGPYAELYREMADVEYLNFAEKL